MTEEDRLNLEKISDRYRRNAEVIKGTSPQTARDFITAARALDRQIPWKKYYSPNGVAFCPRCDGSVWQNANECRYCFRCGQRLEG